MIELKYKTFWRRFWAGMIDGLIFFFLLKFLNDSIWESYTSIPRIALILWHLFFSFSFYAYSIILHGKFGQTIGKKITKVKVLDYSENPLSMVQALQRDIVPILLILFSLNYDIPKIISGGNLFDFESLSLGVSDFLEMLAGTGWFLAEVITMLTNKKRRAIHDFIAGSVVVKLNP